ncbi:MAG: hypothetical protein EXS39_01680 [Opitutaceae bacterium]|nr:hypothetical protein [Opitutaceae bacterium]
MISRSALRGDTQSPGVFDIGSQRELLVDGLLVDRLTGKAELRLHHPVAQEAVLVLDAPWEGSVSTYFSIFQDGDRYRMYYRGAQFTPAPDGINLEVHPYFLCYAESADGIHWRKPKLGLHEFQGSKANNIVFTDGPVGRVDGSVSCTAVFKDGNPEAPSDARYKAILWSNRPKGMVALKSADGIHWSALSDAPIMTKGVGASQNLAFWDAARGEYRAYWRYHVPVGEYARYLAAPKEENIAAPPRNTRRDIRTATSKDFLTWSAPVDLRYVDSPPEELYTNGVQPYFRAPHLLIGFPVRYIERGWSDSMRALPDRDQREKRAKTELRLGTALTEGLIMASRDRVTFKRWNEAFLRPGIERLGTWNYGQQYTAWQLVETKSALEGAPHELSLYATEGYWTGGKGDTLRRYTLRLDGFVSAQAPMSGGELITKPLRFQGGNLTLNFATSAAGSVRVELQDESGKPLPGFALEDCPPLFGDTIERTVTWTKGADVSALANQPVRLRLVLQDADVFAFQFK